MPALLRTVIVAVICLGLVSPAGAARRGDLPTSGDLQRRADAAAVRYDRAVADLSRLADDIDRLERKIGESESRMSPLRATVTRRAVAVYTSDRGLDAFSGFVNGGDLVESARGAKLASGASARDYAAIRIIGIATAQLGRRRDELAARQVEQQRATDDLAAERRSVELALSFMAKRERALQSRLIPRASRGERIAALDAEPTGPIPVVTDFICPIRGPMTFSDTWGAPRGGGRRHEGTDLMNAYGTDNVAVVSGSFETHHSGLGGLSIYLHGDDGHTYYYAHLSQVVGPDRRVAAGELIARTGSSGDATTPHTHFEFHPNGGRAVNSYPLLRAHC
ncbi:MAG TPA: peptidoglycan DD-metalloendopeptidase family protein [Acidimicrobiia bacterium]|nr:peptidoglycan DD-metalloendopeptidase family protein [Acidimicrobiia bacterium]